MASARPRVSRARGSAQTLNGRHRRVAYLARETQTNEESIMAKRPALDILKNALEDLGSASGNARLQLHLLALEARQRTGALETDIETLEQRLDQNIQE